MKVYELMSKLEKVTAGTEIFVSGCIEKGEKGINEIESGVFSVNRGIISCEVEDGILMLDWEA